MKLTDKYVSRFSVIAKLAAITGDAGFKIGNSTKWNNLFKGMKNKIFRTKRKNFNKVLQNILRKHDLLDTKGIYIFNKPMLKFDKVSIREFLEQINKENLNPIQKKG